MIKNYNDFSLDYEFESIFDFLFLNESNYEEVEFSKNVPQKLEKFLSKLSKGEIKYYFSKFLKSIKKLPSSMKRKILMTYLFTFTAFAPMSYLITGLNSEEKKMIENFKTEVVEVKEPKKSSFDVAQEIVKLSEGGYSDDPNDPGNYVKTKSGKKLIGTNHGISAKQLSSYLDSIPTKKDMEDLSYETALKIYKSKFWTRQNLSEFNNQSVANIIYDGCVNQGVYGFRNILRDVYNNNGIKIENNQNPFSLDFIKKANELDQEKLFNDIKKSREKKYKSSSKFNIYGKGWLSRLNKIQYDKKP